MRRIPKEQLEYSADRMADKLICHYSKQASAFVRLVAKKIREKRERVAQNHRSDKQNKW